MVVLSFPSSPSGAATESPSASDDAVVVVDLLPFVPATFSTALLSFERRPCADISVTGTTNRTQAIILLIKYVFISILVFRVIITYLLFIFIHQCTELTFLVIAFRTLHHFANIYIFGLDASLLVGADRTENKSCGQ